MDKDKVLELHDFFEREIKPFLNPMGRNNPSAVATKITSILINSVRHKWNIHNDIDAVRESLFNKITQYNDKELTYWYSDLKAWQEEDTIPVINKIIQFYIEKNNLSKEAKDFYKQFQKQTYWGYKNEN